MAQPAACGLVSGRNECFSSEQSEIDLTHELFSSLAAV
jgi:hypothetical protein